MAGDAGNPVGAVKGVYDSTDTAPSRFPITTPTMELSPKHTTPENPGAPAKIDANALVQQALRHLDEHPDFDWIRNNPLAVRAYFQGLWLGYLEMGSNPSSILFGAMCRNSYANRDWFCKTSIGEAYAKVMEKRADEATCRDSLQKLTRIIETKAEMIEHVRLLLNGLQDDLDSEEILERRLREAQRNHKEIHMAGETAPDEREMEKLRLLKQQLDELHGKQQSLRWFLSQIARMDADPMFPSRSF